MKRSVSESAAALLAASLLSTLASISLGAERGVNLLQNGSFELPIQSENMERPIDPGAWELFGSRGVSPALGLSTIRCKDGNQSALIRLACKPRSYYGVFQELEIEPGKRYKCEIRVLNNPDNPITGPAKVKLSIEWQDINGTEILRNETTAWGKSLSKVGWKRKKISTRSPRDAAYAKVVITVYEGSSPSEGSFYMDSLTFER